MQKILLVEDERNFAHVMRDYLVMNGFDVSVAFNGDEGLDLFSGGGYELCMLDVMMPKKDGFTLAAEIRARDKYVPLLFLTARSMREDVLRGFRTGADDYIVKPFDSEVLLMKIRAILSRRGFHAENGVHVIGSYRFDSATRLLRDGAGKETRLSPKGAALLNLLCTHKDGVLTRSTALKTIWNEENYFTGRSMDVYIAKLRKLFAGDANVMINNVHGNGYSLRVRS
jgi:two-component system, OmpR family, response regulator